MCFTHETYFEILNENYDVVVMCPDAYTAFIRTYRGVLEAANTCVVGDSSFFSRSTIQEAERILERAGRPVNFSRIVVACADYIMIKRCTWVLCTFIWLVTSNYRDVSRSGLFRPLRRSATCAGSTKTS